MDREMKKSFLEGDVRVYGRSFPISIKHAAKYLEFMVAHPEIYRNTDATRHITEYARSLLGYAIEDIGMFGEAKAELDKIYDEEDKEDKKS